MQKLVPWSANSEWKICYDALQSESSYAAAVDLLLLWKSRSPSLPVAVDSTLLYLQTFLENQHAQQHQRDAVGNSLFAMFIIRFINGFADQQQTQFFAQSVTGICAKLGIPRWLVDLRHECTHDKIPSYEVLYEASAIAFEWLKVNYWQRHLEFLDEAHSKLFDLMQRYKRQSKIHIEKLHVLNQDDLVESARRLVDEFPLLEGEKEVRFVLFRILMGKSFLISRKDPSKAFIKSYPNVKRVGVWYPLLETIRQRAKQSAFGFLCEIFEFIYEMNEELRLSADYISRLGELLNLDDQYLSNINSAYLLLLKDPSKVSNIHFMKLLNLLLGKLQVSFDEKIVALLAKSTLNSTNQTGSSSSIEEKYKKLQELKGKIQQNEDKVEGWKIECNFDLSLPIGQQIPNSKGLSLYEYLSV